MREFIDLPGASGAAYRFRLWPEGQPHQPIAGNYVFVKATEAGIQVLTIGATNDLSRARASFGKARKRGATHVYTRLNVARAARETEHQDLIAQHPSAAAETPAG